MSAVDITGTAAADVPVGIIGLGQLGLALAQALQQAGVHRITVFNTPNDAAFHARAQQAGLACCAGPEGLCDAALVFSTVTPMAAEQAARTCVPALTPQAIYVDLNSMGPQPKRLVAAAVQGAGRRFVDGAVLGAASDGHRMPIICSGTDAAGVVAYLGALGMNARAVGPNAGDAAAIKIVRSVLAKGLETLYVEALLAARSMGVGHEVLHSFCDWLDARPAAHTAELLVKSHVLHAERRRHELAMSVQAVRQAGVWPVMAGAVQQRLALTADAGVAAALQGQLPASLEQALVLLENAAQEAQGGQAVDN